MNDTAVQLSATGDHRMVAAEVSSHRTIEWVISAADIAPAESRAPLNLALVLDRSGSMSGEKLRYVQQAAAHVIDLLDARDRLSVVAYDDSVTLVAPSSRMAPAERQRLKDLIAALRPGGMTDLSGGWLTGCREVAAHQSATAVNRALLLTDGLANRGITDVEELLRHGEELRRRGVMTSTFGVGLDFNEHLLEELASHSGGHFYFIENPGAIPDVFRRELGELLTVVAREAVLSIRLPVGVAVEPVGDLPHERDGNLLRFFLGDLCSGERRVIYTRVLTPPDAPGTSVTITAELGYADRDGRGVQRNCAIGFSYVREAEVRQIPVDAELLRRCSEIELAAAATRALRQERAGRLQEAQATLQGAVAAAAPYAPAAASAYTSLADKMSSGLTEVERKQRHADEYRKRFTRDAPEE
jgi:Ca-activated chloride channel family protein